MSDTPTVKELSTILREWLADTLQQELDKGKPVARREDDLGAMLQPSDDGARKARAQRFREALAGMETLLLGQQEIEYRPVLDHVLNNIGASLQGLGLMAPEAGLANGPTFDYRDLPTFPALVTPRRFVALPLVTRTLNEMGFARLWGPTMTAYLVEYREWQPRLLRRPGHDDERFGLFVWQNLYQRHVCFLPMSRVPGSRPTGLNELVMLGNRTTMLGRLFDADPRREEHIQRLSAQTFTRLLRALLLDYERLHTARQREVAEQDQLGAVLWDFLSRDKG